MNEDLSFILGLSFSIYVISKDVFRQFNGKIGIIDYQMEQVKFRTVPTHNPNKKYIFNKIHKSYLDKQHSINNNIISYQCLSTVMPKQQLSIRPVRKTESDKRIVTKTAKAETANRTLSKQTIKKLRNVNTRQSRSSEAEMRGVKNLKDYIRSITKICNNLQKSKAERATVAKPKAKDASQQLTINNLSFSEIQQEKIENQKLYLSNFKHLGRTNSKMITTANSGQEKDNGESLLIIYRKVDRLYEILEEMEELGYFKRRNKSIIHFCTNNRIWLSKVFLVESSSRKDAFSIKTEWLVVPNPEEAKEKLSTYITRGGKNDFRIINNDIKELLEYLQQALSQKKLIEISKLGDYIQARIKDMQFEQGGQENVKMLRVFQSKPQEFNLSKELNQLQEKYGTMNNVTKVSRKRFQDLNRTYDKLKSLL